MEPWAVVLLILFVLVLLLGAIFNKAPQCETCKAPIYSTKVGYRHKPGHAPSDGHKAVLLEKKSDK